MNSTNIPSKKEEKMIAFKKDQFYTVMIIIAFAVGILTGYFIWGQDRSPEVLVPVADAAAPAQPEAAAANNAAPAEQQEVTRYDIPTEGFPYEGPADAPIVIVEFSDFQCPYCTKWHNETYKPLLEAYPDQIKLVYRNFPLTSIHPDAYLAAEAAMCAGDQDSYWPYHEALFESKYGLSEDALKLYGEELGLDMDTFNSCLDGREYEDFVRADMNFAVELGVSSTPTFFVNGLAVVGAQPIQVFQQIIDAELAGEIPN